MKYDNETGTLNLDEYELHDIICGMNMWEVDGNREVIDKITITPKDPDEFSDSPAIKYRDAMNTILDLIRQIEVNYHDDAEHTC